MERPLYALLGIAAVEVSRSTEPSRYPLAGGRCFRSLPLERLASAVRTPLELKALDPVGKRLAI